MTIHEVLSRFPSVRQTNQNQWEARCPGHDDQRASLSIGIGNHPGHIVVKCQAGCPTPALLAKVGLKMSDLFEGTPPGQLPKAAQRSMKTAGRIVDGFDYCDEGGELLYQVVRFHPKDFRQRRPCGNGNWTWNLADVRRVLYRLPELMSADPAAWVFCVEGEKDVENLRAIGLTATTSPGGSGKWHKLSDHKALAGRRVCIIPDNDKPGRDHAQQVATAIKGTAADVRILSLPNLPEKGDVSDWLDGRDGAEPDALAAALVKLAEEAPTLDEYLTEPTEAKPARAADGDNGDREFIANPEPLRLAEGFLAKHAGSPICRYRGSFYGFNGRCYVVKSDEAIDSELWSYLDTVWTDKGGEDGPEKLKPRAATVREVRLALPSRGMLLPDATTTPCWLDGRTTPRPDNLLPCANGLVDLSSKTIMGHTPTLFATHALPYEFNAAAPDPVEWRRFLESLWSNDPESIATLQEWFGYFLAPDTKQQKILLLYGPKRSGKGTIARVISALLGPHNVAAPTLNSLADRFGLACLMNKLVAIVDDARLSGKTDQSIIVERLLTVSGEGQLTVDQKHKDALAAIQLPCRFMLMTNELPRLVDTSGALAGRFVILRLRQSFYGCEDTGLADRLLNELPGILQWSIAGRERLQARGHFMQPRSANEDVEALEDLSSPVVAFVQDRCRVGPGYACAVDRLYEAWCSWCREAGRDRPGTKQVFGRDLKAALPRITLAQPRDDDGGRYREYEGIGLLS